MHPSADTSSKLLDLIALMTDNCDRRAGSPAQETPRLAQPSGQQPYLSRFLVPVLFVLATVGCTRTINVPMVMGFVRSPFEMTTSVEWTLYHVVDHTARPISVVQMSRSIDSVPGPSEQRAVYLLHLDSHGTRVRGRVEVLGARRLLGGGSCSEEFDIFVLHSKAMLIGSDIVQTLPYNEPRIAFVCGVAVPDGTESMTIEQFAAATNQSSLVLVVRWFDHVKEQKEPIGNFLDQLNLK